MCASLLKKGSKSIQIVESIERSRVLLRPMYDARATLITPSRSPLLGDRPTRAIVGGVRASDPGVMRARRFAGGLTWCSRGGVVRRKQLLFGSWAIWIGGVRVVGWWWSLPPQQLTRVRTPCLMSTSSFVDVEASIKAPCRNKRVRASQRAETKIDALPSSRSQISRDILGRSAHGAPGPIRSSSSSSSSSSSDARGKSGGVEWWRWW